MSALTSNPPEVIEVLTDVRLTALDASLRRWQRRRRVTWILGDKADAAVGPTPDLLLAVTVEHLAELGVTR